LLAEFSAANYFYIMIEKTLNEIESKIQAATSVGDTRKRELLDLLGRLKTEVAALSKTHDEQAQSIAGFAHLSAHEATRAAQNTALRELSVRGLRSSVQGFEQSHPQLVQVVNNISNTLANLGI
jgi:hypothetical protein